MGRILFLLALLLLAPMLSAQGHYALGKAACERQDYAAAVTHFKAGAAAGDIECVNGLGTCYFSGQGVRADGREAKRLLDQAARAGLDKAWGNLAILHLDGAPGIQPDPGEAVACLAVAVSLGLADASDMLRRESAALPPVGRLQALRRAEILAQGITGKRVAVSRAVRDLLTTPHGRLRGGGTGFFVTGGGGMLTCRHVVEGAREVWVAHEGALHPAVVVAEDAPADAVLLLVSMEDTPGGVLPLSIDEAELGEPVFTIGFPMVQLQGTSPKFTRGEISARRGFRDDSRCYQVSVPVQPGNSGGPLVDMRGNVLGMVAATVGAGTFLAESDALPQNVNYAVKASPLVRLLRALPSAAGRPESPRRSRPDERAAIRAAESAVGMVLAFE
jgi:S1-C subfamily serine protease